MKQLFKTAVVALGILASQALANVIGYWTTIDDKTGKAKSVVQIYEYKGKYYGRIVDLLENKNARAATPGKPLILGMDIIWDLEKDGDEYEDGEILDPTNGKVYGCEIWREGKNLIVRGKIAFLGRNQTWLPNTTYKAPEGAKPPVPQKPLVD